MVVLISAVTFFAASLFGSPATAEPLLQKLNRLDSFKLSSKVPIKLYDPFKRAASLVKSKKRGYRRASSLPRVSALMNDKAFVNGRWVHVGETVAGFKIAEIKDSGVVLKKGKTVRYVPVTKNRRVLKIKDIGE
ncbi:MAG: hypothetical protein L3J42_06090 [Hydrogenimonas sp.]|nr:hypothetical protein [Hydrogenimonas sp.]